MFSTLKPEESAEEVFAEEESAEEVSAEEESAEEESAKEESAEEESAEAASQAAAALAVRTMQDQAAAMKNKKTQQKEEAEFQKRYDAEKREVRLLPKEVKFNSEFTKDDNISKLMAKLNAANKQKDATIAARDAALAARAEEMAKVFSAAAESESEEEVVPKPCTVEKTTFAQTRKMPWFSPNECCGETRRGKDGHMYKSIKPRGQKSCVWKRYSTLTPSEGGASSDDEEAASSGEEEVAAEAARNRQSAAAALRMEAAVPTGRPRRAPRVNYKGMAGGFTFDHLLSSDESS